MIGQAHVKLCIPVRVDPTAGPGRAPLHDGSSGDLRRAEHADEALVAVLGPTNTGKTHRAIERMLEHRSGMIGLPLRLLAREVYDRVSAQTGEAQVALITGEEKRVPARPRYWICTVEAMPMGTPVDFLAVDEIQLASHPERGHVFTERLLDARGRKETWFLGADTMRDVMAELVPGATFVRSPRLSTLRGTGSASLTTLPKRSAVVAFSLAKVFELAERMKRKRGGVAVVVGALSPRARNAQVALYQSKEVDFIVATDAIGMGLNLDIDHVAFAETRKFDGRVARDLDPAELGQIAGRAGRYTRDGTFGTVNQADIPPALARTIESHRFPAVRALWWRNAQLTFASIVELQASLRRASMDRSFKRTERATDQAALDALADKPHVREIARDEATVKLLWSVCSIPDYRQILFEDHISLLGSLFGELASHGRLSHPPIERELDRIEQGNRDLEGLMDRIASIRTWNYVANQGGWVDDAAAIRARASSIEDALSDQLHAELVARFVEPSKLSSSGPKKQVPPPSPSSPFAKLAALAGVVRVAPDTDTRPPDERLAERAIDATHEQIRGDAQGWIELDDQRIGRLVRGRSLAQPEVIVSLDLQPGWRMRLSRRLLAWSRDLVGEIIGAFSDLEGLSSAGRGLAHLLSVGLGTVLVRDAREQLETLTAEDRKAFVDAGVVFGRMSVYHAPNLKLPMVLRRVALAGAHVRDALPAGRNIWPVAEERSIQPSSAVGPAIYTAIG